MPGGICTSSDLDAIPLGYVLQLAERLRATGDASWLQIGLAAAVVMSRRRR